MELVQIYFKKTKQLLPTNFLKLFQFFSQIFFLKIFPPGSAYLMLKNTVALEKPWFRIRKTIRSAQNVSINVQNLINTGKSIFPIFSLPGDFLLVKSKTSTPSLASVCRGLARHWHILLISTQQGVVSSFIIKKNAKKNLKN